MRLSFNDEVNISPDVMKKWISDTCNCSLASANQALNDVVNNRHKATPWVALVAGVSSKISHVSAGKAGTASTCTIFYVEHPADVCHIVALGCHVGPSSYSLTYVKAAWVGKRVGSTVDLEKA